MPDAAAERERLIAAARAVLARRSWSDAKVDAILREARLSKRAFYRHFESKDQLMLALLDEEIAVAAARLARLCSADAERTAEGRVFAWIDAIVGPVRDADSARRTSLFAMLWANLERDFPDHMTEFRRRLLAPLIAAITDGRRGGAFPDADPDAAALAIHYLVSGMVQDRAAQRGPGPMETEVVRRFVSAALRAGPAS